jgi:hypothetical protein
MASRAHEPRASRWSGESLLRSMHDEPESIVQSSKTGAHRRIGWVRAQNEFTRGVAGAQNSVRRRTRALVLPLQRGFERPTRNHAGFSAAAPTPINRCDRTIAMAASRATLGLFLEVALARASMASSMGRREPRARRVDRTERHARGARGVRVLKTTAPNGLRARRVSNTTACSAVLGHGGWVDDSSAPGNPSPRTSSSDSRQPSLTSTSMAVGRGTPRAAHLAMRHAARPRRAEDKPIRAIWPNDAGLSGSARSTDASRMRKVSPRGMRPRLGSSPRALAFAFLVRECFIPSRVGAILETLS